MGEGTTKNLKSRNYLLWIYYTVIGAIFLAYSIKMRANIEEDIEEAIYVFSFLIILIGIGEWIGFINNRKTKEFYLGEFLFLGTLNIATGSLILSGYIQPLIRDILIRVEDILYKMSSARFEFSDYSVVIFIALFMIFTGAIQITLRFKPNKLSGKTIGIGVSRILFVLRGVLNFLSGIALIVFIYAIPELYDDVLQMYVLVNSLFCILIGICIKLVLTKKAEEDSEF